MDAHEGDVVIGYVEIDPAKEVYGIVEGDGEENSR